jgi:hypothetical protein
VNQTEEAAQQPTQDDIELRQQQRAEAMRAIMADGGRVVQQRTDFPQPVFRNDRVPAPSQRVREYTVDDYEMRDEEARPMATHPLFRGLLQELPSRTSPPSQEWLDRWTSTARSILELLYSRDPLA